MSLARTWALAVRVALQMARDRRSLFLLLAVPALILLLVGYILENTSTNLKVAVVVGGGDPASAALAQELSSALASADIKPIVAGSRADAEKLLRDGDADAFVLLDETFGSQLLSGEQPEVVIGLEGGNPQIASSLMTKLARALASTALTALSEAAGAPAPPPEGPLKVKTTYLYGGPQFDTLDNLAPALIAFFAFLFVFALTSVSFLRERTLGTLERLMATPVKRAEVMLGYMLGFGFYALLQSAVILILAVYVLRIDYAGHLAIIFLLTVALAISGVSLGIFASAFARTEQQALQFLPLVVVPQGLLSGVLFPLESLPWWLEWIARFLPLTYAIEALRNAMIKGMGLFEPEVALDVGVLLAFAAFFIVIGSLTLRREVA
jgi:ABC-2 type transport system permease protein